MLTWGTVPDLGAFMTHVMSATRDGEPVLGPAGEVFHFEVHAREYAFVAAAVNQGIDAHLEAVHAKSSAGTNGRVKVTIADVASLRTLVRRLAEAEWERPYAKLERDSRGEALDGEGPGDLASSIMDYLGWEWC